MTCPSCLNFEPGQAVPECMIERPGTGGSLRTVPEDALVGYESYWDCRNCDQPWILGFDADCRLLTKEMA